ncbi:uncharacterized protein LOC121781046 isoform X2 [Salvia splendens]|uniref:uncharacterized protein LOC121781046 isoform X2 n=1 Tax=Salvia splendens TaxID=180675 RepID=UPI001C27CA20|nr:uncharacterized protein LOC121781046 isoform X2 [Salvia splendens]
MPHPLLSTIPSSSPVSAEAPTLPSVHRLPLSLSKFLALGTKNPRLESPNSKFRQTSSSHVCASFRSTTPRRRRPSSASRFRTSSPSPLKTRREAAGIFWEFRGCCKLPLFACCSVRLWEEECRSCCNLTLPLLTSPLLEVKIGLPMAADSSWQLGCTHGSRREVAWARKE